MYDNFSNPCPFIPDMAVCIDDVMDEKTAMLNCHASQVYEFLPWMGDYANEVPPEEKPESRLEWLKTNIRHFQPSNSEDNLKILRGRYGNEKADKIIDCEAFQLSEYGNQAGHDELEKLFPL